MATKKSLAEQALRVIQGGSVSDDADIDIREIMLFIEQERDALIKQMIMGYKGMGEHEITGDFLSSLTLMSHGSQVLLTYSPINLPNGAGVFSVNIEDEYYLRKPSSNMYNKAISKSGRKFYELLGNTISLFPGLVNQTNVTVKLVASSKSLGETDNFPVPADLESTIIKNTVQLYTLMRTANEDNINDRIDNK